MRRITAFGVVITIAWISTFAAIIYLRRDGAAHLSLNELGDFLGGFMAPLALLWVVLGYLQQGEELRLATAALQSQQVELRNQTQETARLAEIANRQFELAQSQHLHESLNGWRR